MLWKRGRVMWMYLKGGLDIVGKIGGNFFNDIVEGDV